MTTTLQELTTRHYRACYPSITFLHVDGDIRRNIFFTDARSLARALESGYWRFYDSLHDVYAETAAALCTLVMIERELAQHPTRFADPEYTAFLYSPRLESLMRGGQGSQETADSVAQTTTTFKPENAMNQTTSVPQVMKTEAFRLFVNYHVERVIPRVDLPEARFTHIINLRNRLNEAACQECPGIYRRPVAETLVKAAKVAKKSTENITQPASRFPKEFKDILRGLSSPEALRREQIAEA